MTPRVRRGLSAAAVLSTLAFLGCGGDSEPPITKPTAAALQQLHAAPFPVYWLGTKYRGVALTSVEIADNRAAFHYGWRDCGAPGSSEAGCDYQLTVYNLPTQRHLFPAKNDTPATAGPACFKHIRRALLMGCPGFGESVLLTDRGQVALDGQDDQRMATRLRPMSVKAQADPFAPPVRIPCAQFRGLPQWFAAKVPASMRPAHCA